MISPEDLKKEAEEIEKELYETNEEIKSTKNPLYFLIGIILILSMILWIVPNYSIKIDPRPSSIPSYDEVIPNWLNSENLSDIEPNNYNDYLKLYEPNNPQIKYVADMIVQKSCEPNNVCHAKAIFEFLKQNFNYVNDPTIGDYVKHPIKILETRSGDCEDASVLLINLLGAVGIRTRLIFIPGHVYVQAYLPNALKKYQTDGWVNLDVTCQPCGFGQIIKKNVPKTLVEV